MKIARVFPSKTTATPDDDYAFIGMPPKEIPDDIKEIHISVTFTWDLSSVDKLYKAWSVIAPVTCGGPALGTRGEAFTPGMYLKKGIVITSRGCPNKCWFCNVWKRDGTLRELPITDGNIIQDDNILACSENHIRAVFDMLSKQKEKPLFTGGIDPTKLKQWHIDEFKRIKTERMYFAYDGPEDREPMYEAGKLLKENGYTLRKGINRAYCLIGQPKDTFEKAQSRLEECMKMGFIPFAMLYRDKDGAFSKEWKKFQNEWTFVPKIYNRYKETYFAKEAA